jgi:hypothetical protein
MTARGGAALAARTLAVVGVAATAALADAAVASTAIGALADVDAAVAAAAPPERADAGAAEAAALPLPQEAQPAAPPSERLVEVLRLDCASRIGRREVTLFGNGTIRLRDGPIGKEWMGLAELAPEELAGTLRRLAQEDLADASRVPPGVAGDWVEKCDLVLELPGQPARKFFYGRYDPLPLGLYHVQRLAEELAGKVAVLRGAERLPERYEPRLGDVLKRTDGSHYRVVNFTSDRKAVELDGLDQPLHLVVLKEQMRLEFVAIVSRER